MVTSRTTRTKASLGAFLSSWLAAAGCATSPCGQVSSDTFYELRMRDGDMMSLAKDHTSFTITGVGLGWSSIYDPASTTKIDGAGEVDVSGFSSETPLVLYIDGRPSTDAVIHLAVNANGVPTQARATGEANLCNFIETGQISLKQGGYLTFQVQPTNFVPRSFAVVVPPNAKRPRWAHADDGLKSSGSTCDANTVPALDAWACAALVTVAAGEQVRISEISGRIRHRFDNPDRVTDYRGGGQSCYNIEAKAGHAALMVTSKEDGTSMPIQAGQVLRAPKKRSELCFWINDWSSDNAGSLRVAVEITK